MKFASARQVVAISVAWGISLYAVDLVKRPRGISDLFTRNVVVAATHSDRPHLSLWFNHLCCSGCLSDVSGALAGFAYHDDSTT